MSETKRCTPAKNKASTSDKPPLSGVPCPRCAAVLGFGEILTAFLDRFAVPLAARLAEHRAPPPYSQDNPPPGMTRRSYLDAAARRDFPTSKAGRTVLCERSDFEAYLAKRRRDAVEHPAAHARAEPCKDARPSSTNEGDEIDAIMVRSGTVRRRTR